MLPFAEGENYSSSHGRTCTSPVLDGVEFVVPEKPLDWNVQKVKEYVDTQQNQQAQHLCLRGTHPWKGQHSWKLIEATYFKSLNSTLKSHMGKGEPAKSVNRTRERREKASSMCFHNNRI